MWYDGPIGTAIGTAKAEKRLLIIFVHGADEISNRVARYWENEEVKTLVIENGCIALKLVAESAAAKQFGQIYPVVSIPISFFIVPNGGTPLEVLAQYDSLEIFKEKLVRTIQTFKDSQAVENRPHSSHATLVKSDAQPQSSATEEKTAGGRSESPSNNMQQRVERTQALIRERQEQKALEAEEKARLDEMKRREEGREFQKAQDRLKEQEALKNAQEQKKAKKDDKEYLKKLRDQIAADRAEKASKYSNDQDERKRVVEEKKQQKVEMDEKQRQLEEEQRKRFALLQFRLPDGSALRNQFDGSARFSEAEVWVAEQIRSSVSSFQLVQMFPRREFTEEDKKRAFVDLGLTPSAVLMVLPNAAGQTYTGPKQASASLFSRLLGLVTAPIRYIYNFVYMFIFGAANAPRPVTGPASANNNPTSSRQPGVSGTSGASGVGRPGNVARLRNADDSQKKPDDNATWNGNSTQQL